MGIFHLSLNFLILIVDESENRMIIKAISAMVLTMSSFILIDVIFRAKGDNKKPKSVNSIGPEIL